MLVHHFLEHSAVRAPDATAVIARTGTATYGALEGRANQIARLLVDEGVSRGDRVVVALENSPDWIAWYFGVLKAGGTVVPLAADAKSGRLEAALVDCAPTVCVCDWTAASATRLALVAAGVRVLIDGAVPADAAIPSGWGAVDDAVLAAFESTTLPAIRTIDVDLAAIIYTSGSTGRPRGVMLSHLNICANTQSIVSYLKLQQHDRVMVVLPLHYVYGLSLLHTHAAVGGSLVIENRSAFPNVALKGWQEHAVTGFAGVPSTFALLLHRSAIASMRFPALRYVTQAGGPMAPALIRQWQAALPDVPLFVMYGATEAAARLAFLDPSELDTHLGSIGRAIPNVELRLLNGDNEPVGPGEVGEIVARGSNISSGYWNAPEETRQAFGPEGYHTGDLARADEDGFLYIVGRTRDMLKVGAHRIGAKEIEDVLQEHPAVHEAAVVGTAHDLLGEVAVGFVSCRDNGAVDNGTLLAFCRTRLPDYKVPVRIAIVDDLPKSEAGKIDKRALRALAESAPATVERGR